MVILTLKKKNKKSQKARANDGDFEPILESLTNIKQLWSKVSKEQLIEIRSKYHISKSMGLRASMKSERSFDVKADAINIYFDAIYVGLRFPVQPFFQRVINTLGVAPHQVNPKIYRYMSIVYVL